MGYGFHVFFYPTGWVFTMNSKQRLFMLFFSMNPGIFIHFRNDYLTVSSSIFGVFIHFHQFVHHPNLTWYGKIYGHFIHFHPWFVAWTQLFYPFSHPSLWVVIHFHPFYFHESSHVHPFSIHFPWVFIWVCLKIVYPIVPNGFADHYPVSKWLAIIGNIPNIFRQTHMGKSLKVHVFH